MIVARLSRAVAVSIAIAGALDVPSAAVVPSRARVSVVEPLESTVADRLRTTYLVERGLDPGADAIVVVGRAYPDIDVPPLARVATVTLPQHDIRVMDVGASPATPAATTIRVEATVQIDPRRPPAATTITARIGGVAVGEARHDWAGATGRWRATLDVIPIGDPPYAISVSAGDSASRTVLVDRAPRLAVTFYEPRPSWATTFLRRALERDPRFAVTAATRLPASIEDASAVVVGGTERVTSADAAALDRFARERGGAVVIVPDEALAATSPAARLVKARPDDRLVLLEQPAPLVASAALPRLIASELLAYRGLDREATVFERLDPTRAVVWAMRRGAGRVVVSGALDAWRFRAAADRPFDRFWSGVVAGAALATPRRVEVTATPSVAAPGETIRVHVRMHPSVASGGAIAVSATQTSGAPVRLWPDAERGAFSAAFAAPSAAGSQRVVATVWNGGVARATGSIAFAVARAPEAPGIAGTPGTLGTVPLALLSATHGGIDTSPADLAALDRWLRATVSPPQVRAVRRPMRSPWWMLPLFVCLSIDWWITSSRRRRR